GSVSGPAGADGGPPRPVRPARRQLDGGVLRPRRTKPLVHPRLRRRLRARIGLRIPSRRLAVRARRGDLVGGGGPALVGRQVGGGFLTNAAGLRLSRPGPSAMIGRRRNTSIWSDPVV